ncbi:MAG: hypothetical protein ACO3FB_01540, partial [Candidatus Nanopelagicaceae bacterium]
MRRLSVLLLFSTLFVTISADISSACDGPFTPDPERPGVCIWTGGSGTYTGGSGGSGGTWTPADSSTSTTYTPTTTDPAYSSPSTPSYTPT